MIVGSGVDVIEIARVEQALARRGERFLRRVFTPREIADCQRCRRPGPALALRFAAKEAAMKAVGTGWARGVRWVDIETAAPPGEPARLRLHGRVAELATSRGGGRTHLALSRSRALALALVVLESSPR